MSNRLKRLMLAVAVLAGFNSCAQLPKGATAVADFDANLYLGKWYEIARFDFRFERDLNNTTAEYSMNENGTIKVVNKGYNYVKKEWKEATGKAKFAGAADVASLKVSFFGPFYAPYNVIAIDIDYQYALVVGKNTDYMWILSREKTIPDGIKDYYLQLVRSVGFDTDKIVWVEHDK